LIDWFKNRLGQEHDDDTLPDPSKINIAEDEHIHQAKKLDSRVMCTHLSGIYLFMMMFRFGHIISGEQDFGIFLPWITLIRSDYSVGIKV
jgi:hypothetical protein